MHSRIAIVDPYSSGALLAPAFLAQGRDCVAVMSMAEIYDIDLRRSFRPDDFISVVVHNGDTETTAAALSDLNVGYILGGCDTGVELADQLSTRLILPTHTSDRFGARRDKFRMIEALHAAGVRAPKQCLATAIDQMADCVAKAGPYPVVIKPLRSTNSDGVRLCHSSMDAEQAFDRIFNRRNILGEVNTGALVQEYLEGTEYVVDTVSWNGVHRVVAFWQYSKPPQEAQRMRHRAMQLLPGEGALQSSLRTYARAVLDALGVCYGPCHLEIIVRDGEPLLVEMATRMNGGSRNPVLAGVCANMSQVDQVVRAATDPEAFLRDPDTSYTLRRAGMIVFLMCNTAGILRGIPGRAEIEALPSLREFRFSVEIGEHTRPFSGWASLVHEDAAVIAADLDRIQALEVGKLFEVEAC